MRQPKYAGTFYEQYELSLSRQIENCFLDERGPGTLPSDKKDNHLQAVIVPHAGYVFSGPCAAWAYKEIGEAPLPDLFILIGPSHHFHESGFSMETFETPLGFVRVHQNFARQLSEKGSIKQNEKIHVDEHCLEVQLPFLQFVFKKQIEKIKILPILIGDDINLQQLSLDLKETLMDMGLKAIFIISSDFTHFGPNYHYVPFSTEVKQKIYDLDGQAIDLIKKFDVNELDKFVKESFATICGFQPIKLLLKTISSKKVSLKQYYTSGDVQNSYKNSVSYASIVFK